MNSLNKLTSLYLEWAPMSLAIREVTRINALKLLDSEKQIFRANKILDVGCGDGKWWTYILPDRLNKIHGIDISISEVKIAQSYIKAQLLDISSDEFLDKISEKKFDLVIGNCSIEHIYHIDKALMNIYEVLEDGGTFILMLPTPFWALKGRSVKFLNKISPRLSMSFSGLINGFFQHWHLYNHNIWKSVLVNFNFQIEGVYGLGNARSEFLFRLGLPTSFISFVVKCITGKYLNHFMSYIVPNYLKNRLSAYVADMIDKELRDPKEKDIFEYLIVCKKNEQ